MPDGTGETRKIGFKAKRNDGGRSPAFEFDSTLRCAILKKFQKMAKKE